MHAHYFHYDGMPFVDVCVVVAVVDLVCIYVTMITWSFVSYSVFYSSKYSVDLSFSSSSSSRISLFVWSFIFFGDFYQFMKSLWTRSTRTHSNENLITIVQIRWLVILFPERMRHLDQKSKLSYHKKCLSMCFSSSYLLLLFHAQLKSKVDSFYFGNFGYLNQVSNWSVHFKRNWTLVKQDVLWCMVD